MDALVGRGWPARIRKRRPILRVVVLLNALFLGLGGGPIKGADTDPADNSLSAGEQRSSATCDHTLQAGDLAALARAATIAVRVAIVGVCSIILVGGVMAYVLIYVPPLKPARPFDPEKERHETRKEPLRLM